MTETAEATTTYPDSTEVHWGAFHRAARAALLFASKDVTRENLNRVLVRCEGGKELIVAATDGHRLIEVRVQCFNFTPARFSLLVSQASLKDFVKIQPINPKKAATPLLRLDANGGTWSLAVSMQLDAKPEGGEDDLRFPPHRECIPDHSSALERARTIGIDPKYLADAGQAAKILGGNLEFSTGAELDPIRFELRHAEDVEATMVIMPMRI